MITKLSLITTMVGVTVMQQVQDSASKECVMLGRKQAYKLMN